MKAEVINLNSPSPPMISIRHDGLPNLDFSVSCFGRDSFEPEKMVFDHLNQYWESLSAEKQLEIYNIYADIQMTFGSFWEKGSMSAELRYHSTRLADAYEFDKVQDFLRFRANNFKIPSVIEASYDDTDIDKRYTKEQTYVTSEYVDLVTMAVILRSMIPVWGEHITNVRREIGNNFKELDALTLISKSKLLSLPVFERLLNYISVTISKSQNPENGLSIIAGISSEDYPYWMTAMVCVRRLTLGDISGKDPKAHLVAFIHKFVNNKAVDSDVGFDKRLKSKKIGEGSTDLESKLSALERYKIRANISVGSVVAMEEFADVNRIVSIICPEMNPDLLNTCLTTSAILNNKRILDPQIDLMRWTLGSVVSPRGIPYLNKNSLCSLLGLTEAILYTKGYPILGLLATAYVADSVLEHNITAHATKSRIPEEFLDKLDVVFPFQRSSLKLRKAGKVTNAVRKSVDELDDQFTKVSWILSAADGFITQYSPGTLNRRFNVPGDLKTQLTKLCIDTGERKWHR